MVGTLGVPIELNKWTLKLRKEGKRMNRKKGLSKTLDIRDRDLYIPTLLGLF